ncbi:MAG: hypothetical protein ACKPKO_44625, partial [Candidatus Fonsibacter sp.]
DLTPEIRFFRVERMRPWHVKVVGFGAKASAPKTLMPAPAVCISTASDLAEEIVQYAAVSASAIIDGLPDRWLLDSGSGNDLIGEDETPACLPTTVIPVGKRPRLQTANGDISVDKRVVFALPRLGFPVQALQLHRTPAVLSLGKRCVEEG